MIENTEASIARGKKVLEEACRAWWEIERPDGSRVATMSWDEFVARAQRPGAPADYQRSVDDYRARMTAALIAAMGLSDILHATADGEVKPT